MEVTIEELKEAQKNKHPIFRSDNEGNILELDRGDIGVLLIFYNCLETVYTKKIFQDRLKGYDNIKKLLKNT